MSLIPTIYLPPLGIPLYWRNEQSGVLEKAVNDYFNFLLGKGPEPDEKTVALLVDYLDHFIFAPCWEQEGNSEFLPELKALRVSVKMIKSAAGIRAWNHEAMEIGLDPF